MITVINLTNNDIYNYSNNIEAAFCEDTRYFPARINFYIQKNAHILKEGFLEIEETRNNIKELIKALHRFKAELTCIRNKR